MNDNDNTFDPFRYRRFLLMAKDVLRMDPEMFQIQEDNLGGEDSFKHFSVQKLKIEDQ